MKIFKGSLLLLVLGFSTLAWADQISVSMSALNDSAQSKGIGGSIGAVVFKEELGGLVIEPNLKGLTEGFHGFHIHQNPSCEAEMKDGKLGAGLAAGGHFDPDHSNHHSGPFTSQGHLGDLPALYCDQGSCTMALFAPRLKLKDLKGHSLMIHADGDNYSDDPKPLGGGGARVACGVIP